MKIFDYLNQNAVFRTRIVPLIISLTLFVSVLIVAATPPSTGYELSIYEVYSPILWVLLSINIFFSIYTIIRSCDYQSKNLYYGYFSILLIETMILFLPIIRGYYSIIQGAGDIYYHMFVASQILNSGYFPLTDDYPVMHIWLSILYNFLSDFIILTIMLSMVFFGLYVLSLYNLGKTLLGTKKGGIFVSIFGLPLIFSNGHYAYYPFLFALLTFPLILYIYQKMTQDPAQKNSFYICLMFLSFFIVFCHPMISVFLIIVFSLFTFFELFKRQLTGQKSNIVAVNIVLIVSLALTLWWLQFRSILNTLQQMLSALIGQEAFTSIVENQMDLVTTSNASILLVIDRFVKVYGTPFLYFFISLCFIFYIFYQYFQNKKIYEVDFIYSLQFCAAICVGIALMFGYFIIAEPIRAAMYGLVFATILCGLFFYRERHSGRFISLISVIITIVCILAIMTLYISPYTLGSNRALTYGDKDGINWILEYRNTNIPIVKEEETNVKYAQYYFETMKNTKNFQYLIEYNQIIPSHFGYDTNRTIGDSFAYLPDADVYMITTEMMRLTPYAVPIDRRSQIKSFNDKDFIYLNNDPTVNLIYLSNKFEVWNIAIPKNVENY